MEFFRCSAGKYANIDYELFLLAKEIAAAEKMGGARQAVMLVDQ